MTFKHRLCRSVKFSHFCFRKYNLVCISQYIFFALSFCPGASKRSRFTFGRSQWRTPFLFLLLPSDLIFFLWHSESGWTFLWALHCLLLSLLLISHLSPNHTQPLVLTSPLRYYLSGPHQRHHAFRGQNCHLAIRTGNRRQASHRDNPKSQHHPRAGID